MAILTPFSTSPNPRLLYLTPALRSVVAKIRFVVDQRQGLTAVLGDVGMGKSSIVRLLHLEYSLREDCKSVMIPTPNYSTELGLLKGICKELGIPPKRTMADQEDELKGFLLKCVMEERNCVVWIDEAQRLTRDMLELVRTLLNLETNEEKLIQIVLSGQLELRDRLREPGRRALASRIMTPSLLSPLSLDEANEMILFRLQLAGEQNPFTPEAVEALYTASGGVPRDALKMCSVAWETMKALEASTISTELAAVAIEAVAIP